MTNTKLLVSLVAVLALVTLSLGSVSAFANIDYTTVNDVQTDNIAVFAGETLPVRVVMTATADSQDVVIKAWLAGSNSGASTGKFDVIAGNLYTKTLYVTVPSNLDLNESKDLQISVENGNEVADTVVVHLTAQRESYVLKVLDVAMDTKVNAGDTLAVDVVLKNRGSHLAEDAFVTVRVPALGIEERTYFGDLSAEDQANPDKEDASEGKVYIHIPSNVVPGIYDVVVQAFNADSDETVVRKIAVVGGARDATSVVTPAQSKTAAVGETAEYSLTIVNSGSKVRVYEISLESNDKELSLNVDQALVVVPAGTSKEVKISATASEAGKYSFTARAKAGSEVAGESTFALTAKGSKAGSIGGNDAAVVLTVVLAIIFVVLLVVLIVLLTRKPQKVEEFGESYY